VKFAVEHVLMAEGGTVILRIIVKIFETGINNFMDLIV